MILGTEFSSPLIGNVLLTSSQSDQEFFYNIFFFGQHELANTIRAVSLYLPDLPIFLDPPSPLSCTLTQSKVTLEMLQDYFIALPTQLITTLGMQTLEQGTLTFLQRNL